jgi:hypothetical protein
MHKIFYLLICVLIIICCKEKSTNITIKDSVEPQWRSLFDGKSMDNWTAKIAGHQAGENFGNTFRAQDGLLSIRYDAYGDDFDNRFGALYFNQIFTNYRLKVEYRFIGDTAPGAPEWGYRDSGIQYHAQSPESMEIDQPFPLCLEYNLHGGNGIDDRPVGAICANGMKVEIAGEVQDSYCTAPQISKTFHGDQWVMAEIEVTGDSISHFVNGIKILSFHNPRFNPYHDLGKTFINGGNDHVRSGYISLQSNSHPIDIRKIEIMEF